MASVAVAPDPARERLYAALTRRNRLVGVLRIALPVAGALVLAVVLGGIVLDNLREQFGFASIHIDRDNLVVDSPRVTAAGDDGTLYAATARMAKVRIGSTDLVDMTDAVFNMTSTSGVTFSAAAPAAALQTAAQTVTVPGRLSVWSSDGLRGTLDDFFGDMLNYSLVAHGAVDLTFPEGMQVQSQGMTYDGNAKVWTFNRAMVMLQVTPGGTVEDLPPVMELAQLRLWLALLLALVAGPALAAGTPVKVTADSFVIDQGTNKATFTGAVVITRGSMTMWADKAVVNYGDGGEADIDGLDATGNVRIRTDGQEATGNRATFTPDNSTVRLSGNVRVKNATGTMSGPELTINLSSNSSTFKGSEGGRVTGVFTPQ